MITFRQLLFISFTILQWMTVQAYAETNSHIVHTYAWTAHGLTEGLNEELMRIQEQAYNENKFFEFVSLSLPDAGWNAFILYNISDRVGETNPFITQIAFATAWTPNGIAENLQDEINSLQNTAYHENKVINILDVKIRSKSFFGYLIYEISK